MKCSAAELTKSYISVPDGVVAFKVGSNSTMDGLSSAASGIAVASIAIQLVNSIKMLCDFWGAVKNAPNEINAIFEDLELLSTVLSDIRDNAQANGPEILTERALTRCETKIKALLEEIQQLLPDLASTKPRGRKWSAFKVTLKAEKIKSIGESLKDSKMTLLLVQNNALR